MLKRIFHKTISSVWFKPAVISIISFILALLTGEFDTGGYEEIKGFLPPFFLTSLELSRTILGVLAAALMTMTIFTFSTTMVVLTTYSSQYSPRVVSNFLQDDRTMSTLGYFMGGFIYTIMALSYMRNTMAESLMISAIFGVGLVIFCLVQFLKYINHVAEYIQMNNLIQRLTREARENIDAYRQFVERGIRHRNPPIDLSSNRLTLTCPKSGYIQSLNHHRLESLAVRYEVTVLIPKIPGQYLLEGSPLIDVYFGTTENPQDWEKHLPDCIDIGNQATEKQDFIFSMVKINEIAVRALSPGINDPDTAIHCTRILSDLLVRIAAMEDGYLSVSYPDSEKPAVIYELVDFGKVLHDVYYSIILYGKGNLSVLSEVYKALKAIESGATEKNRESIHVMKRFLLALAEKSDMTEYEKEHLAKIL